MSAAILDVNPRRAEKTATRTESAGRGLYTVGGVCLIATGLIYILGAVLAHILGPPPSGSESYLKSLAGHATLARINFGLFALTDFLLVPAVLALYLALRHVAKNAMLVAAGLILLFVFLDLAITELNSLTLVTFAVRYAAAMGDAERSACATAADFALATLPLATFFSYVVSSVGFLIVSLVMLRDVFSKATAYLGITACVEGIVGGFYVVWPLLTILLIPCLITFGLWSLFAGAKLWDIGRRGPSSL